MAIELVEVDEVTLAVEQAGEGDPLLLVAGGFMDKNAECEGGVLNTFVQVSL